MEIHKDELEKKLMYFVQCIREGCYSGTGNDVNDDGIAALQNDVTEMFDEVLDEEA